MIADPFHIWEKLKRNTSMFKSQLFLNQLRVQVQRGLRIHKARIFFFFLTKQTVKVFTIKAKVTLIRNFKFNTNESNQTVF